MSTLTKSATPAKSGMSVRTMVTLAMLTCLAYVVMLLSKSLPSVSGFLDFDFKDVIICIGGFTFGPMAAALISVVVALLEMFTISHTGPIGLLMNVLATTAFCCTASFVYRKKHTMGGAVLGLALGTLCLTAVMLLWNYLITPLYMEMPREVIAAMLPTIFLPFNLVKGGMNMGAVLLLYKPVVGALRKARLIAPSTGEGQVGQSKTGFLLFSLVLMATFVTLGLVLMGVL